MTFHSRNQPFDIESNAGDRSKVSGANILFEGPIYANGGDEYFEVDNSGPNGAGRPLVRGKKEGMVLGTVIVQNLNSIYGGKITLKVIRPPDDAWTTKVTYDGPGEGMGGPFLDRTFYKSKYKYYPPHIWSDIGGFTLISTPDSPAVTYIYYCIPHKT